MVADFNGKPPVKNAGANVPDGKVAPAAQKPKPILSTATIAKARGGSAALGSGIGNS